MTTDRHTKALPEVHGTEVKISTVGDVEQTALFLQQWEGCNDFALTFPTP
jgi:hypothetical protein